MISYHFYGKQLYFVNPVKNVAILILTGLNTFEIDCRRKKGRLQAVFDLSISPQWMRDTSE